jgi:uncharacterized repeat protein (TIGR03847 family)
MPDPIEFHSVDALGAGAVGQPGQRAFYLQARSEAAQLTVLLEKEQVALLAAEAVAFLDRIAEEYPEDPITLPPVVADLREPTVPLFRARLIGLGFDPERELVLIELRERADDDEDDDDDDDDDDDLGLGDLGLGDLGDDEEARAIERALRAVDDEDGYVARIYATRPQVRAMAARGAIVVTAGRPPCDLCGQPMDPAGHRCPRWN